jgi:hypothetical protein
VVKKRRMKATWWSSPREGRSGGVPIAQSGREVEGMEVRHGARCC